MPEPTQEELALTFQADFDRNWVSKLADFTLKRDRIRSSAQRNDRTGRKTTRYRQPDGNASGLPVSQEKYAEPANGLAKIAAVFFHENKLGRYPFERDVITSKRLDEGYVNLVHSVPK